MPSTLWPPEAHPSLATHWKHRFGERVRRVGLDPGFSCPNRDGTVGRGGCSFCDPASFAPSSGDPRSVTEQLRAGIQRLARKGVHKVAAYFQPHTNTHAPLATLREAWDAPLPFPEVVALCVGTRPDCVADPVLDLLASYRDRWEVWLELGLQSASDATLSRLRRGHGSACFADACGRARSRGLRVCAHVILGLPGEGVEDEARTAAFLARSGIDGVKLHQLSVVRGTALEAEWRAEPFPLFAEEAYAERAAAFVGRLPASTVLHRLVGDVDEGDLVAPNFDKRRTLAAIRKRLEG